MCVRARVHAYVHMYGRVSVSAHVRACIVCGNHGI